MKKKISGSIAFQGEKGANSHTACRKFYKDMVPVPCHTFEEAFEIVKKRKAKFAMIPIENTIAGRVADIHQLLPNSGLHIVAEHFLGIHFHLMATKNTNVRDVRTVHSHVHALGQCRKVINKNKWQPIVEADTAGAAKMIAQENNKHKAAIAPKLAAEIYKLKILKRNIEDEGHNTTRFIVLAKKPIMPVKKNQSVTTFVFQVRNVPAALYKVLGGFATNGVNMTKLESYQIGGAFTATMFYADIEGHPEQQNVKYALDEMDFFCSTMKILGVYQASPSRKNLSKNTKK